MLFGVQEAVQQHTHVVIVPGSDQLALSEEDSVHDALAQRMSVLHYRQFGRGTRYIGGFLRVAHVPPRRDGTPEAVATRRAERRKPADENASKVSNLYYLLYLKTLGHSPIPDTRLALTGTRVVLSTFGSRTRGGAR